MFQSKYKAISLIVGILLLVAAARAQSPSGRKLCIAEGGAAAYAPVHSMASYRMALEMKADFIETDLQLSKDLKLVCIHDLTLEHTSNVEKVFPDRFRAEEKDGKSVKAWYVFDFTLEELRKLDTGSWFNPKFAGEHIVTLQELIDLVKGKAGLYAETKDPDFYKEKGADIDLELHKVLAANGLNTKEGQKATPLILESFHRASLKKLRELGSDNYTLIQLVWFTQFNDFLSPEGLKEVAKYANGIGPVLSMVLPPNSWIVYQAHALGLAVHPWILYEAVPGKGFDSKRAYMHHLLYDLGVDGVFTEEPDQFPRN